MNSHMSDEQVVALALGESNRTRVLHLEECTRCREEIQSLRSALDAWIEDVAERSRAPESFWRRQREAIAARLARPAWLLPWKHLAWATATLTLVLLATAVLSWHRAPAVRQAPVDDDALLRSVHESVNREVPQALQPVTLLTQEIARADQNRPTSSQQEAADEDRY
jgi:predicted anti-sigma-YlaC factor YlaD